MRRAAVLILALGAIVIAAGCGGGDDEGALSETAAKLGEIRSGELSLSLVAEGGEARAGFELLGPFELRERGLPVAEIAYTQIAAENRATVTFISTGEEAFVEVDGETYVLPEEQASQLRQTGDAISGGDDGGGLGAFALDEWLVDAEVSEGEEVDGVAMDRITASLNVVAAANDLLALLESVGRGNSARIEGEDAENLERATESATVEILTGAEDRLLRSLVVDLQLKADAPDDLRDSLGPFGQARFHLELGITKPNEPVAVEAPANAEPFPDAAG